MNTNQTTSSVRQTAINGLAIVGFIALVVAGIWLAVYSTRFVPAVVNRIGSAAVYLGSVFSPAPEPAISVVSTPVASTTLSFDTETAPLASTTTTTTTSSPKPAATAAGVKTNGTYSIGTVPATVTPYGLSDLAITISAVGYLTTASTDSFVTSSTVPDNERPAIKFTIKNIGTNWSGTWRFDASVPTRTSYVFKSEPQQSLAPGDSIDYTLGFDRAKTGSDQPISITVDFSHAVPESNENNNNITASFNIL